MIAKYRTLAIAAICSLLTAVVVSQAQVPGVNSTLASVFTLAYDNSTMKPTYSATQFFAPASAPTDVCSLSGSATKVVKVRRVIFGGQASAVVSEAVSILKRSTAYAAGQGGAMNKTPYDSTNSLTNSTTNTSTVNRAEYWTANPTLGTLVGVLADIWVTFGNLTTGPGVPYTFTFGQLGSPVVLRGIAQQIAVNMEGNVGGSGLISCTFEWTEE